MLGIKTLVKSYLAVKDALSRTGIDKLMALLRNVLAYGDISNNVESRYWRKPLKVGLYVRIM